MRNTSFSFRFMAYCQNNVYLCDMKKLLSTTLILISSLCATAQTQEINDVNTPLHLMQPQYDTPYGEPKATDVKATIDRIMTFLEGAMPAEMNGEKIKTGQLRLTSYEIGVLYCAAMETAKTTGDTRYSQFTADRLNLVANAEPTSMKRLEKDQKFDDQMRKVCFPTALDDAGAMCAGFIRMVMADGYKPLNKKNQEAVTRIIERYIDHVYKKQYRLADGTLARIRPHYNTVWLDDMYMGIPCLAWYGKLMEKQGKTTEAAAFYDEAVKQIRLFREKMWIPNATAGGGLFRHGWVEEMNPHPFFPWGRANGWAVLTMCEVLDVLPANHPGRDEVLTLLRSHIAGLCSVQDKTGFWHQLLNDPSTYLETSATAIYAYCIAHAICEGWIDALAYGAQASLAWNAVATQVNAKGHVENTCVGSGMGFDPAFYAYRPVHVMAAHGYGPVIWAGGEIIRMLKTTHPKMNDSALHFYPSEQKTTLPIFSEEREGVEKEDVLW